MNLPVMNKRSLGLAVVLIGLLALFGNAALRSGPLAPVEVTEVIVQNRALSPALFGVGTIEARYTSGSGRSARALAGAGCRCRGLRASRASARADGSGRSG